MTREDEMPDFEMEDFFDFGYLEANFDINTAFQEAIYGVATDEELILEEKVRRMEVIVSEGSSEVFRDFIDLRMMAAQMEMFCNHDHMFNQVAKGSETLNGFMDYYRSEDGHNHSHHSYNADEDDDEIDPKTGKKKRKINLFGF